MTTNLQRAAVVSRHVQLHSVTLVSAEVESSVDPRDPPDALEVGQRHRAHHELRDDAVYVSVEFEFSATSGPEEEAEGGVELTATYLLVYELDEAARYPEDAVEHFAGLNGPYNAWPYWRELVQTVCGRAGIAAIVVPVFRPAVRTLTEEEEAAASTEEQEE